MNKTKAKFNCECAVSAIIWNGKDAWVCPMCRTPIEQTICRAGCNTQDHESYWECLQAANVSIDKTSLRP
jgi:hypothetical protein